MSTQDLSSGPFSPFSNQPINLEYKAFVYNNTDIDWKDINFKLSTADPTLSATQPNMTPWYLNYKAQSVYGSKKRKTANLYQQRSYSNEEQSFDNNY
mgnify:CR=1 FL=1